MIIINFLNTIFLNTNFFTFFTPTHNITWDKSEIISGESATKFMIKKFPKQALFHATVGFYVSLSMMKMLSFSHISNLVFSFRTAQIMLISWKWFFNNSIFWKISRFTVFKTSISKNKKNKKMTDPP